MTPRNDACLSESIIREALGFVDASDRETWVKMGMAVKSELDERGFDLWNEWSQKADSYDSKSASDVWKSIKPDGAVTIGSLVFEAKKNGYVKQKRATSCINPNVDFVMRGNITPPEEPTAEQVRTAQKANLIWNRAAVATFDHPYLIRKHVKPTLNLRELDATTVADILGYRPKSGGIPLQGRLLIVPVRRLDEISTLELIDEAGAKSALAGQGTKTGGYWSTNPSLFTCSGLTDILIGEGVATVLSAAEATGFEGVAALTSVNLSNVASEMRRRYPEARLIILADIDRKTGLPDTKASHAARNCDGCLAVPVFPEGSDEEVTDFNDMAVFVGIRAVKDTVEGAAKVTEGDVGSNVELSSTCSEQEDQDKRQSQASLLVDYAQASCELFHDVNREVYAKEITSGEVRHLGSRSFRDWLLSNFYETHDVVPRDQAVKEAVATLSGLGRYRGACHEVFIRVARHSNCYYLDLAQPSDNSVVEISAAGWKVVDNPPVYFVRYESMQPLPKPMSGGDIEELWKITNIPERSRLLVLTWLCECLRPETPFPVLELVGEQGSAKSTTQAALRRMIDPNACDLRGAPKAVEDTFVSAGVAWLLSYENISYLSPQMQDAICIMSTGGGFAKRKLYTDGDETVIAVKRPVVLNGISVSITAQDLVDRTVSVEMPVISERQDLVSLWNEYNASRAHLLGALLDLMVNALKHLPEVKLSSSERPRLLEFASLGAAVAMARGLAVEDFMAQFNASRDEAIARTIDASPVATAMIEWYELQESQHIRKSVKSLFSDLERYKPIGTDAWPRSAKGFGDALRRCAPALRSYGIECRSLGKVGGNVQWEVMPTKNVPDQCPGSPGSPDQAVEPLW
jgi:phage/plasmid primase-like uncharacterized protein